MLNNKIVRTCLGCLITVFLSSVILFEVKGFFSLYGLVNERTINEMSNMASQLGKDHVKLNFLHDWPTAPSPDKSGEVFKLADTGNNVRVSGKLVDTTMDFTGSYSYMPFDDTTAKAVMVSVKPGMTQTYDEAYIDFLKGDCKKLSSIVGYEAANDSMIYQQNYVECTIPVIWDQENKQFFLTYKSEDGNVYIVSAPNPVELTKDIATIHYGDPSANPMYSHTYSDYEIWAANNTLKEKKDKDKNSNSDVTSYGEVSSVDKDKESDKEESTNKTSYTSSIDNDKRKKLAEYASLTWNEDGTCKTDSSAKLDITGAEAKKSQWLLTSSSYSYTVNGLSLTQLNAKRDAQRFTISCNINNTLEEERPYVVVFKFISEDGKLLGVKVADKRTDAIESKGVAKVSVDITKAEDACPIDKIVAVQFELY